MAIDRSWGNGPRAATTRWAEFRRFGDLLLSLTWRDLRVRYRQSFLGIAWAVLLPASMMLVFTFVFTRAMDTPAILRTNMPYALYAFVGLVPWTFLSSSLGGCVNSLTANRNLVSKVYFPREVFPLSCVAGSFVDYLVAMTVVGGLIGYFHVSGQCVFAPTASLLLFPVVLLLQITLTIGCGLFLAMANLFYRDVRQLFSVAIQLTMFVSAVVVPVPRDGSTLARVLSINPLVPIIDAYRACLILGCWPDAGGLIYAGTVAVVSLIAGWIWFRRSAPRFAECI